MPLPHARTHIWLQEWEQFVPALNLGHLVLAPWCQRTECEENVKVTHRSRPRAVCLPCWPVL